MYFRKPMPVASSVYRTLDTRRYMMMPMGGFWPVIQKLPNGHLGVVTRDGDFHVGERGRLVFVTSPDGGESWSRATVISAEGPDNRNPGFGVAADGTLLASYIEADRYVEGQNSISIGRGETTPIYLSRSSDGGVTWSPGKLVHEVGQEQWSGAQDTGPDASHQYASPFGKMVTLPDGTILMPYGLDQLEEPNKSACFLVRSHDHGRTWTDLVTIAEGHDEPSLCHLGDGHVIAMLRSKGLWQCDSHDSGYTWTEPRRVTGDMEFPGDVLQLRDGRLLLTYGRRVPPYGIQGVVSRDEGRTWDTDHRLLLVGDSGTTDCGYPSSVQREDGAIVTVYYAWDTLVEHYGIVETGVHGAALIYRPEDLP